MPAQSKIAGADSAATIIGVVVVGEKRKREVSVIVLSSDEDEGPAATKVAKTATGN